MHRDPASHVQPEPGHPQPSNASPFPDRGRAIEVESVVTSIVMIGLMCFTGLLFSACFDLVTIA